MENKTMNMVRSAMVGMAVGTALTAAGALYLKDNQSMANDAVKKARKSKRIITRAGEDVIREIKD
ncbi:MAG: hypothetical protein IJN69_06690 [Oscillospiraceae bacterium]|nr:hypothetical protein [Oscillospiraceae bacterium]MBR2504029.1 hypothetical protein [Oscillospiraceae bacterium]